MEDPRKLLIESSFRNILEKFNPSARHFIAAGKAYLKALHGADNASKIYIEALQKLALHANHTTWEGSKDIGTAILDLVEVQKDIQSHHSNILKAFYIDLLVPLESNLEKDTKVVLCDQKKFLQNHKTAQESYLKAAAVVKKQKKKTRGSGRVLKFDKEFKNLHTLEEEKGKLDVFCEQHLRKAICQERRRYGFVLERQCSLMKHYQVFYTKGQSVLQGRVEEWELVSNNREFLPDFILSRFSDSQSSKEEDLFDDGLYGLPPRTDSSCLDLRDLSYLPRPLARARSDFNLASSSASLASSECGDTGPQTKGPGHEGNKNASSRYVRALHSYLSSGEHQLSFHEGDVILLAGARNKGWHFGENLRNNRCGWFPIAYTEPVGAKSSSNYERPISPRPMSTFADTSVPRRLPSKTAPSPPLRPPRRSLTAPLTPSLYSSSDSGIWNEKHPITPTVQINPLSKLIKTGTGDRSPPTVPK